MAEQKVSKQHIFSNSEIFKLQRGIDCKYLYKIEQKTPPERIEGRTKSHQKHCDLAGNNIRQLKEEALELSAEVKISLDKKCFLTLLFDAKNYLNNFHTQLTQNNSNFMVYKNDQRCILKTALQINGKKQLYTDGNDAFAAISCLLDNKIMSQIQDACTVPIIFNSPKSSPHTLLPKKQLSPISEGIEESTKSEEERNSTEESKSPR